MVRLMMHVSFRLLHIIGPCSSKATGQAQFMEEYDYPFGWIPFPQRWPRTKVMRESVLNIQVSVEYLKN